MNLGAILTAYAVGTDGTMQLKEQTFEGDDNPYNTFDLGHGFLKSTPDNILRAGTRETFTVGTDQGLWFLRSGNPNWVSLGNNIIGNPDAIMDAVAAQNNSPFPDEKVYVFVLKKCKII